MSYQGDVIFDEAYGFANLKNKVSASTDYYHRIASVSKAVTRACIDALVTRGKLRQNQKIFDLLDEFDLS